MPKKHGESAGAGEKIWLTPPDIIRDLGPFDLDPCFSEPRPWSTAGTMYGPDAADGFGGLFTDWFGFVWCNPPYGDLAEDWLAKMAEHKNGIAFVFARTETRWFKDQIWAKANSVLFLEGRVSFRNPDGSIAKGNAGAPSALVGYGAEATRRLSKTNIRGKFFELDTADNEQMKRVS